MSKKYLDTVGLNKLVANILSKFAAKNHSHSNATTNSAGFMSSSDKVKLDGVSTGANRTIVDSTLSSTSVNAIQNKAVKTALDGKASSSHTHPTSQITGLDAALAGKASASHKHDAGDITSGALPIGRGGTGGTSATAANYNILSGIPASSIDAADTDKFVVMHTSPTTSTGRLLTKTAAQMWAWIKSKCDAIYAAKTHNHDAANITSGTLSIARGGTGTTSVNGVRNIIGVNPITTTGNGSAYVASVPHISTLVAGATFTMIPHVVSTATSPTLNVNGLGAKAIRQRLSNSTLLTAPGAEANWLAAGKPVEVVYDGSFWIVDFVRPNMASAYGVLPVANGGTGGSYSIKTVEVKHTFIKGQDDMNVRLRQEINTNNPVIFGPPSIRDSIGGQSEVAIYSYEIGSFEYHRHGSNGAYTVDISFQYVPNSELPTGLRIELDIVVPFIEIAKY